MITVGMNYEVLDGKGGQFEAMFNKVLAVMQETAGHGQSSLWRDVNNGNAYLIVSEWTDRGAFDGFVASERFKGVVNWGREQILAGRPRHVVYENASVGTEGSHRPESTSGPSGCPVQH